MSGELLQCLSSHASPLREAGAVSTALPGVSPTRKLGHRAPRGSSWLVLCPGGGRLSAVKGPLSKAHGTPPSTLTKQDLLGVGLRCLPAPLADARSVVLSGSPL